MTCQNCLRHREERDHFIREVLRLHALLKESDDDRERLYTLLKAEVERGVP